MQQHVPDHARPCKLEHAHASSSSLLPSQPSTPTFILYLSFLVCIQGSFSCLNTLPLASAPLHTCQHPSTLFLSLCLSHPHHHTWPKWPPFLPPLVLLVLPQLFQHPTPPLASTAILITCASIMAFPPSLSMLHYLQCPSCSNTIPLLASNTQPHHLHVGHTTHITPAPSSPLLSSCLNTHPCHLGLVSVLIHVILLHLIHTLAWCPPALIPCIGIASTVSTLLWITPCRPHCLFSLASSPLSMIGGLGPWPSPLMCYVSFSASSFHCPLLLLIMHWLIYDTDCTAIIWYRLGGL